MTHLALAGKCGGFAANGSAGAAIAASARAVFRQQSRQRERTKPAGGALQHFSSRQSSEQSGTYALP